MEIADLIREIRKQERLIQEQFAAKLGGHLLNGEPLGEQPHQAVKGMLREMGVQGKDLLERQLGE